MSLDLRCLTCGHPLPNPHQTMPRPLQCPGCGSVADLTARSPALAPSTGSRVAPSRLMGAVLVAGVVVVAAVAGTAVFRKLSQSPGKAAVAAVGGEEEIPDHVRQADRDDTEPGDQPVKVRFLMLLWKEYGQDEKQADRKYLDKLVDFKAKGKLERDAGGSWILGLPMFEPTALTPEEFDRQSPQQRRWFTEGYPANVLCYFAPGEEERFRSAGPDRECSLQGVCAGKRPDPDVGGGYVVILRNCRLLK